MKELTEKEEILDKEEEKRLYDFFLRLTRKFARKYVVLSKGYYYFIKNKVWILSLLFVLSIVRSSIFFALFGVNILAYSNLQDIFLSFADYFMSIIIIGVFVIFFYFLMPHKVDKITKIILIFFLVLISGFVLALYRMIFSILELSFIVIFCYSFLKSKMRIAFLGLLVFLLMWLSLFQPIFHYWNVREGRHLKFSFSEKNAYYDITSFDYNNTHIDTKAKMYYLIGCNSDYFFIFDREAVETLIIPKSECQNIKSHPFSFKNLLYFDNLHSPPYKKINK